MTNLGELIRRVQRLFGDEAEAQIERADITTWLNEAQTVIARATDSVQGYYATDAVASARNYDLHDDFISVKRLTYNKKLLTFTSVESLDSMSVDIYNTSGSDPSYYFIWNDDLWLVPPAPIDGEMNIEMFYSRVPAPLVNDSDTPEIKEFSVHQMVRYALSKAKELDEQNDIAARLFSDFQLELSDDRHDEDHVTDSSYPAIRVLPGDEG